MKKSFAIIVILTAILVYSCQKEIDWGTAGNLVTGQKLVKVISKTGTDSTTVTYSYDNQNRLIKEVTIGISGGTSLDNNFTINRNGSGIILNTVQKSVALAGAGIDSILTSYYYNATTSIYTSSVFSISTMGFTVTDSAVYSYDPTGKIASDVHYLISGILPPIQALRNQYTYSPNGINLIGYDQFAPSTPGGPLTLVSTQAFSFDLKINPLIIKNEAILLVRPGLFNANNNSKLVLTSSVSPAANFTQDYTYVYNSSNKPDSSYATRTPGGTVTAAKFFYQ